MKIIDKKNKPLVFSSVNFVNKGSRWLKVFLLAVLLIVSFVFGVFSYKNGSLHNFRFLLLGYKEVPKKYIQGKLYGSDPKVLNIEIKFKNYQKLESERQKALAQGLLTSREFVSAKIRLNDELVNVDLRLKGDWLDHLNSDKWSFRVKVKKNKTLLGMKIFSLQHPKTRNYVWESLYHKMLAQEGVVSLRYDFVKVVVNGKDLGVYAIEEHFEKRLLENNNRKEGPIIRFSEDTKWSTEFQETGYDAYSQAEIDVFQTQSYLTDSVRNLTFQKSVVLLESMRNKKLLPSEIFDVDLMAKCFAISDLFGGNHGTRWHNRRFYYNPITSKLEPVGYDAIPGKHFQKLHLFSYFNDSDFYEYLYSDKELVLAYIQYLEKFTNPAYLDTFFKSNAEVLENQLHILYHDFPMYVFDKSFLYANQHRIKEYLYPTRTINGYLEKFDSDYLYVKLGNPTFLPVEVSGVSLSDRLKLIPENKIVLEGKSMKNELISYETFVFKIPENFEVTDSILQQMQISSKTLGTLKENKVTVFPWDNFNEEVFQNDFVRETTDFSKVDFIRVDSLAKEMHFKKGLIQLTESLHFPKGYTVFIHEGTTIDFTNKASIISYAPFQVLGLEDAPVEFISSDKTGQGIFVVDAKEASNFEFVHFKNLSAPSKGSWNLSGAVTFYQSEVHLYACSFSNNLKGDDYLNIVRSKASIENTAFVNSNSDALDVDFSEATLKNCSFFNCGNDGIDTSGSKITLENILVNQAKDKAISSGERSIIEGVDVVVKNAEIAICSKDLSSIRITGLELINNKIAFTAFQKKPEFGKGIIECENLKLSGNSIPYLIEKESVLTIDGVLKYSEMESVKDLLYGVKYGKSSK